MIKSARRDHISGFIFLLVMSLQLFRLDDENLYANESLMAPQKKQLSLEQLRDRIKEYRIKFKGSTLTDKWPTRYKASFPAHPRDWNNTV